jgi:DNA-binding response OmpR family regulator
MRCLLVLAETACRLACRDYLTLHGFELDSCTDLDEAERWARFRPYDCVIADMERGDAAPQLTKVIGLARKRSRDVVPVLLATAGDLELVEMQPFIALTKPVPLRTIVNAVKSCAAGSRRSMGK